MSSEHFSLIVENARGNGVKRYSSALKSKPRETESFRARSGFFSYHQAQNCKSSRQCALAPTVLHFRLTKISFNAPGSNSTHPMRLLLRHERCLVRPQMRSKQSGHVEFGEC